MEQDNLVAVLHDVVNILLTSKTIQLELREREMLELDLESMRKDIQKNDAQKEEQSKKK